MTVQELIAKLQELDPTAEVLVGCEHGGGNNHPLHGIYQIITREGAPAITLDPNQYEDVWEDDGAAWEDDDD